ncbi:porin [Hydrogenophaga pseudoflava]|uniref:porin n=1 Tax=Hydrogenophaga pseudoflava TaxID=47421 RepID=UPI0027E539C0|nr:porin [Hydrogenophaga pseudoflava]MDQ7747410.1 porin [Hydrogenophaga pseudoflava]
MFKHSVVAFALATATFAIHAQSSVSISGIVDLGLTKGNGGTAANAGGNGTSKDWMQKQATPSRLVFKGTEDLGSGASVSFVLDHRFTPDDGVASATFWGGRSLMEIGSAKNGTVYMGREYSPAFWVAFLSDPFQWGGVGQIGLPQFAGFSDSAVVRTNNTLGYLSPRFADISVRVATGLGEGVTPRDDGISVDYRANGIYAAVGFQKLHGETALGGGNSLTNLALHYDFGVIRPMLYVARSKTVGGTVSNQFWDLAAVAPFGVGNVKVAYSQLKPGNGGKQTKISLGYEHYLSKRTNVYFDAGSGRETGKSTNTAYGAGIRHTF